MSRPAMSRAGLIVWAPAMVAVPAWPLTLQDVVPPARWVAGVLLAFLLPGLAATAALFFGRALSIVERMVLAPALSLAVLVLGGLLLNAVGVRLTTGSWATLTGSATIVFAGFGYLRWWLAIRRRGPVPAVVVAHDGGRQPAAATRRQTVLKLGSLAAVALLLVGASWLAMTDALEQENRVGFTALSMVGANDTNVNDALRPVDIAVDSHEWGVTQYVVRVSGDTSGVLTQFRMSLVPGQVWKTRLEVPLAEKVTAQLYRGPVVTATPYRVVFMSGRS